MVELTIHSVHDGATWYNIPDDNCLNYSVTECGRIYSNSRLVTRNWRGKTITQRTGGQELKCSVSKVGYRAFASGLNGVERVHYVHVIVALTFLGPRPEGYHVCHCDGNKLNNNYTNLRYDSPTGNAADRKKHGTGANGVNNPMNKYSEDFIAHIKYLLLTKRQAEVSRLTGIPNSTVGCIKQGKTWSHVEPKEDKNIKENISP